MRGGDYKREVIDTVTNLSECAPIPLAGGYGGRFGFLKPCRHASITPFRTTGSTQMRPFTISALGFEFSLPCRWI